MTIHRPSLEELLRALRIEPPNPEALEVNPTFRAIAEALGEPPSAVLAVRLRELVLRFLEARYELRYGEGELVPFEERLEQAQAALDPERQLETPELLRAIAGAYKTREELDRALKQFRPTRPKTRSTKKGRRKTCPESMAA